MKSAGFFYGLTPSKPGFLFRRPPSHQQFQTGGFPTCSRRRPQKVWVIVVGLMVLDPSGSNENSGMVGPRVPSRSRHAPPLNKI